MKNKNIEIIQDDKNPIPTQILAASIIEIAKAAKLITQGRLSRNCLAALIKDKTSIPKNTTLMVLDALDSLEKDWLK